MIEKVFFITGIDPRPIRLIKNKPYLDYLLAQHNNDINATHFTMRTFLWLPNYDEAEDFVLRNIGDIAEGGTNKWMVIEGLEPSMIAKPNPQVFFVYEGSWDDDTGHYVKMEGWPQPLEDYYDQEHIFKMITTIG